MQMQQTRASAVDSVSTSIVSVVLLPLNLALASTAAALLCDSGVASAGSGGVSICGAQAHHALSVQA